MAIIQIKSEKLTPFGGIFSIMEQFDSTLSSVIDSTLGLRCKSFGYRYSEIIRSLMSTYFCGGSCVEDVTTHLMNHLSLHPTLRTCSSDTILRANSVMRGRFDARRTLKNLVADLRNKNKQIYFFIFFLCFSLLIFFTSPRQWGLRGIFYQRKQLFCHISLCFQIFLLLLSPESDKQRATVSAPAVTVSVALPADIKKPPIETGAGTF